MKPKAVVYALLAGLLMTACDTVGPTEVNSLTLPSTLPTAPTWESGVTTESDVIFNEPQTSPCTSQTILVNANSHWVMVVSFDQNGGYRLIYNVITKGTGTGPSNEPYKIMEQVHDVLQTPPNSEGFVYNSIRKIKVDGPGTEQDYTIVVSFIIKVSPNGVASPSIERSSLSCGAP